MSGPSGTVQITVQGVEEIAANLNAWWGDFGRQVHQVMEEIAVLLENHAKTAYDRPRTGQGFTDRTGNLRNSIDAFVAEATQEYVLVLLTAGMEYAPFVELLHKAEYAFLRPTVEDLQPQLLQKLQSLRF